jgi:hypothetical protein
MEVNIKGHRWTVKLYDEDTFASKYGDETAAFVVTSERTMHFQDSDLSLNTIIHELWHAHFHECNIGSAYLKPAQVEEVSAELIAECGISLIKMARALRRELRSRAKDL